jgi:hypothetical protein
MAGRSVSNPHISEPTSDIQTLARQALRRYGDFAAGTAEGEVLLMFLEFANLVISDIRRHPYWPENEPLDFYESMTDARPIPDRVIIAGLLFHYAAQQLSAKAEIYRPLYTATLNEALYDAKYGNSPLAMTVMDGGSRGGRA